MPAPTPPRRPRIAIACQGGASQTAFTAGALLALFEAGVHERFEIVSLSGTSGGAVCALLTWYALQRKEADPGARLAAFWRENTATTPAEQAFNAMMVQAVGAVSRGLVPVMQTSPAMPMREAASRFAAMALRPEFTDLRLLLQRHCDFEELDRWGAVPAVPNLLVGAIDVLAGEQRIFSSRAQPIRVEHILASAAVPELFAAVPLDGSAYWDGLYSDNPPITAALRPRLVGAAAVPEEVWVIKISPTRIATVPNSPEAITDRRLHLVGNLSLFQQLEMVEMLNELAHHGVLDAAFFHGFGVERPIRHPRGFGDQAARPWHIPFIEMSADLAQSLTHESKIDRSPAMVGRLMADGAAQAREFLAAREG